MQYRVVPIVAAGGNFQPVDAEASDRSDPNEASAESGAGLAGIFNRGIIMSQAVSRFVQGEVTVARLKNSVFLGGRPAQRLATLPSGCWTRSAKSLARFRLSRRVHQAAIP
jgi:hypothetical protein